MSQWLNDTFTGTSGTNIISSGHVAELGGGWTAFKGAGPVFDSTGGRIYGAVSAGTGITSTSTATADNEIVEITFDALSAQSIILYTRNNTTSNAFYCVTINAANTALTINRNSGTFQAVGASKAITLQPTDNVLRIKTSGTGASVVIEVTLNGTTWTETDSTASRVVAPGKTAIEFSTLGVGGTSAASNTTGIHISSITGSDSSASDAIAPTATAAAVANSTPTIVSVTMSEAMDAAFVPAATAFTVGGHTASSVAISGSVISLTCATPFANGEAARTVAYTQPAASQARDVAGNMLASFSGLAITNNVQAAADTTPPSFVSAQIVNSQPNIIQVTMNEVLAASVPPNSAFAASLGRTVTGVSISGTVASVTVTPAYAYGDVVTIAYTQPGANPRLQDTPGNAVLTFAAKAVANNIAAAANSSTFTTDEMVSSGTLRANQACQWTWFGGGEIGTSAGTPVHGSGNLNASARLVAGNLTPGAGFILVRFADGGRYYQEGVAA